MPLAPQSIDRGALNRSCLFATQLKKIHQRGIRRKFSFFFFNSHMNQKGCPHIENENLFGEETLP